MCDVGGIEDRAVPHIPCVCQYKEVGTGVVSDSHECELIVLDNGLSPTRGCSRGDVRTGQQVGVGNRHAHRIRPAIVIHGVQCNCKYTKRKSMDVMFVDSHGMGSIAKIVICYRSGAVPEIPFDLDVVCARVVNTALEVYRVSGGMGIHIMNPGPIIGLLNIEILEEGV